MQVTGKIFQTAFRNRKIPFNVHGVAFYRKKVEHLCFYCQISLAIFLSDFSFFVCLAGREGVFINFIYVETKAIY